MLNTARASVRESAHSGLGILPMARQIPRLAEFRFNDKSSLVSLVVIRGAVRLLDFGTIVLLGLATALLYVAEPIVAGRALKGPTDRMLASLGHEVSAVGVAGLYAGLVDRFVLDEADASLVPAIEALGMTALVTATVMQTDADRAALARALLEAAARQSEAER